MESGAARARAWGRVDAGRRAVRLCAHYARRDGARGAEENLPRGRSGLRVCNRLARAMAAESVFTTLTESKTSSGVGVRRMGGDMKGPSKVFNAIRRARRHGTTCDGVMPGSPRGPV